MKTLKSVRFVSMPRQATFYRFAAVVALALFLLVTVLGGISLWRSTRTAGTAGISAVAGGISQETLVLLLLALVLFMVSLLLILHAFFRRR